MTDASMSKAVVTAIGGVGLVLAIILAYHLKPPPTSQGPLEDVQRNSRPMGPAEDEESAADKTTSLGSLLGINKPAPPPIAFHVGHPPGQADAPDLSTPGVAVYSVLSLIDQGATEKLAPCFVEDTEDAANMLYPRYLGHPIELVEVIEEGESAEVVWNATVHTEFSLGSDSWPPGETATVKTRLVRVEDTWKILKLYNGDADGPQ